VKVGREQAAKNRDRIVEVAPEIERRSTNASKLEYGRAPFQIRRERSG